MDTSPRFNFPSGIALVFLFGALALFLLQKPAIADNGVLVMDDKGLITLRAESRELKQILSEFQTQHSLVFSGLSQYPDKKITLSCTGSVTDVVKKLLKTLGIRNYAFTFTGERLIHVSVLPVSAAVETIEKPDSQAVRQDDGPFDSSTVMIKTVLPGTQGEGIPLEPNDYIIAYGGHKIRHAHGLIAHIKKLQGEGRVNMVIARDGVPLEFILQDGFIGVQVVTVPIHSQTLEKLYRDAGL
ncbi:hypothetical protein [Desulfospira joergensenii]|uniref:hypothetical protein n=1 Tax=Desulfospira joergensenii TaxID=53329 RepID=UPI0003B64642|nr:hypothetical protein [Desulfospira joergensenii]